MRNHIDDSYNSIVVPNTSHDLLVCFWSSFFFRVKNFLIPFFSEHLSPFHCAPFISSIQYAIFIFSLTGNDMHRTYSTIITTAIICSKSSFSIWYNLNKILSVCIRINVCLPLDLNFVHGNCFGCTYYVMNKWLE